MWKQRKTGHPGVPGPAPERSLPDVVRWKHTAFNGVQMAADKFLELPPAAQRDKASFEVLRVWIAEQGQHVSIRSGAWEDPFAWGIVLADLARHITLAHQLQNKGADPAAFLT